jgi:2'-5' RNA ligase
MATPERSLRLFYALWPDATTRDALARLQRPLAGRQMHPEDLHLTLAFLGAQPAALLPELLAILAALPQPDLALRFECLGYFPSSRIAWAGMQSTSAALLSLRAALLAQLARHGMAGAARGTFTPHVTLARNAAPPESAAIEPITWHADRCVLVESLAQENGARYRVLG